MTKTVTILVAIRDIATGEVQGCNESQGTTEDDGNTCVLGAGYLPQLATAQPGDVKVTVHQPVVEYPAALVTSITPDEENSLQVITFVLE